MEEIPEEILEGEIIQKLSPRTRSKFGKTSLRHGASVYKQTVKDKQELIDFLMKYVKSIYEVQVGWYEDQAFDFSNKYKRFAEKIELEIIKSSPQEVKNTLLVDLIFHSTFVHNDTDFIIDKYQQMLLDLQKQPEIIRKYLNTLTYKELLGYAYDNKLLIEKI